jgi:hypothetical protein
MKMNKKEVKKEIKQLLKSMRYYHISICWEENFHLVCTVKTNDYIKLGHVILATNEIDMDMKKVKEEYANYIMDNFDKGNFEVVACADINFSTVEIHC